MIVCIPHPRSQGKELASPSVQLILKEIPWLGHDSMVTGDISNMSRITNMLQTAERQAHH